MDTFWKVTAAVLLAVILCLVTGKQEKDFSLVLSMSVCSMAGIVAISYLKPVLDFLYQLEVMGNWNNDILKTLLKAVGICIVSELASRVCSDAGNGSLAKMMQMLASCALLYLSLPVFQAFIAMIQEMLGEI